MRIKLLKKLKLEANNNFLLRPYVGTIKTKHLKPFSVEVKMGKYFHSMRIGTEFEMTKVLIEYKRNYILKQVDKLKKKNSCIYNILIVYLSLK